MDLRDADVVRLEFWRLQGNHLEESLVQPDPNGFPISCYRTRSEQLATKQWFGSGFGFDPDSIRSVDPFPDPDSESGSGRANMTHKRRKFFRHLMFRNAGCFFWISEGFFSNLDVLYGGLRRGKLNVVFYLKKIFFGCKFFTFLVIKTLDPDRYSA
jgi:hypothetical protein